MQGNVGFDGAMEDVILRRFEHADRDWLVEQHRNLYHISDGFDASFGDLVAKILDDFLASHDPAYERGWIAERAGQRLGSIFCVRYTNDTAQLRLFLLVPEARGLGLGQRMLSTVMQYARDTGYKDMRLWTHRNHKAACALYGKHGWQQVEVERKRSFGQDVIVETYIYRF